MSSSGIFYQVFRPKNLAHVLGQEIVVKILQASCKKESFHHSYLLSGNYGTGKTTIARIIAAMLVCENREQGSPRVCGKCNGCLAVYSNGSPDVQELDGASHRKIENIRSIIESSRYSPQDLKKRIYIIDECHELSTQAMKALLKTLEEPPSTAVFILCTTEIYKLPEAIRSRCQKFFFKPVKVSTLVPFLSHLFTSKNTVIEDAAVECIARASVGSVRDALEMSQEALTVLEAPITEKDVNEIFGLASRDKIYGLMRAASEEDLLGAFNILEEVFVSNVDCRLFCAELASVLRNIMLAKASDKLISDATCKEIELVNEIKESFLVSDLASFVSFFEEAEKCFSVNINNRWVLEAVVVKIIRKIKLGKTKR